jgi:hypothetical protein
MCLLFSVVSRVSDASASVRRSDRGIRMTICQNFLSKQATNVMKLDTLALAENCNNHHLTTGAVSFVADELRHIKLKYSVLSCTVPNIGDKLYDCPAISLPADKAFESIG